MTEQDFKDLNKKFLEHYRDQLEYDTKEIEWWTRDLQRSRQEDRDLVEHIWSKGPVMELDKKLFCTGKYESQETRRIRLMRNKQYRRRKRDKAQLARYEMLVKEDRPY